MKMNTIPLGSRLRRLRVKANMTQKELSKRLDVTSTTISEYENDESVPSIEVLRRYKHVFNADLNWVLDKGMDTNTVLTALNRKDQEMILQFQACSEEEKSLVRQITKVLYNNHFKNDPE